MFREGEHAWILRRSGHEGLMKVEQNLLNFRFPCLWLTFQRMRATRQSIHILPFEGSNHTGSRAAECLKMASIEVNRFSGR